MPVGEKTAEATAKGSGGGGQPKPPSRGSARFERLLSGLGAGPLVDVEPDKVKDEIRRWAKKTPEATAKDSGGGGQPKPPSRGSARFERLLSGLGAGPLVDVEPDKVKDEIRRWAKKVATLVRQLSLGTWAEKSDGSSEHHGAGGMDRPTEHLSLDRR